jgi:hypothetical protein
MFISQTSFKPLSLKGEGINLLLEVTVKQGGKLLRLLSQLRPRIQPQDKVEDFEEM